jgi:hypothetical protein
VDTDVKDVGGQADRRRQGRGRQSHRAAAGRLGSRAPSHPAHE